MAFIAKKVCSFGGKGFLIGDPVPDELVLPERVADLMKVGVLERIPEGTQILSEKDAETGQVNFCINIHAEEGDLPVLVTNEDLQQFFDVMQSNADEAKKIVSTIENENVLILIDVTDHRKGVQSAIKDRLSVLFPQEE